MHSSEEGILALITRQLWAMVPASSHVTPPTTCQGRTHHPHFQVRKLRVLCFAHQLLTQCLKWGRYYVSVLEGTKAQMIPSHGFTDEKSVSWRIQNPSPTGS